MMRSIQHVLIALLLSVLSFSMAFANQHTEERTRLCFMSDLNGSYGRIPLPSSVEVGMSKLTRLKCSIVIGAGDLVAGQDPSLSEAHLRSMWDEFQRIVLKPFDRLGVPMLTALGNHDASAARSSTGTFIYQRERNVAADVWMKRLMSPMAGAVEWLSQEDYPFFYSVRFGTTGIVFIDGSSATEVRRKRAWLESQLSSLASHPSIATRIVVGHLPLFAVAQGRERVGEILADSLELYELFDRNKVDFYVSGHHHAFFPGVVPEWSRAHGTVQIALGALGDGARQLLGEHAVAPRQTISFLDINSSANTMENRFSLQTLSPLTGELISLRELPERLPSLDGLGKHLWLKRFDLKSFFPEP